MSVKYPNYVNLTSSCEEQPNKRTPSPPPRKKSLSPPQAPSKTISSKSTHYTSASSPRKCSIKMHLKHHEEQVKDILNYLEELSFYCIEKMEEGRINRMIIRRDGNKLKTELKKIRTQIIKLQKKQLGQKDKIAFAYYRISDLEQIIEKIQARHQTDQEDL
ncbi:hypothetical protein Tco_1437112 [Tanacetum coccineum]